MFGDRLPLRLFARMIPALLIIATTWWAYRPVLDAPYLFDDKPLIEQNARLSSATPFAGFLLEPRPVRYLTFAAERVLHGVDSRLSHFVNLLLHLCVSGLVGTLVWRVTRMPGVALGAAMLFALNPLAVESVAIASHRKMLLAACGLLAGVNLCTQGRKPLGFATGLAAFAIAVFSHEAALVFPLLCWIVAWALPDEQPRLQTTGLLLLVLWALFLGLGVHLLSIARDAEMTGLGSYRLANNQVTGSDPLGRVFLLLAGSFLMYLWHAVCPFGKCIDHDMSWIRSGDLLPVVLVIAGLCLSALLAGWAMRRDRRLASPVAWIVVALAPFTCPLLFYGHGIYLFAERYAYWMLIGVAWGAAIVVGLKAKRAWFPIGLCLALAVRTYSIQFETESGFWRHTVTCNPRSAWGLNNLGLALMGEGDIRQAEACFRQALDLEPLHFHALCNYAVLLTNQGRHVDAVPYARRAGAIAPDHPQYRTLMGVLLIRQDRPLDAIVHLRVAVRGAPELAEAWHNLGCALLMVSQPVRALRAFAKASECPGVAPAALLALGRTCLAMDQPEKAVWSLERYVAMAPHDASGLAALAMAYEDVFQFAKAESMWQRITEDPGIGGHPEAGQRISRIAILLQRGTEGGSEAVEQCRVLASPNPFRDQGFLVFGDSVPYGRGSQANGPVGGLATRLAYLAMKEWSPPFFFLDSSVPGERTSEGLMRIGASLDAYKPGVCLIWEGHNDALDGTTCRVTVGRLMDMVVEARRRGVEPIIIGPLPVRSSGQRDRAMQARMLDELHRRLGLACHRCRIRYIDIRSVIAADGAGASFIDPISGNHLSEIGYTRIASSIFHELGQARTLPVNPSVGPAFSLP